MKRTELAEEIAAVRKYTPWRQYEDESDTKSRDEAKAAERRILNWYDEISRELEYVGSLRNNLATTVSEKVSLEIEVQELQQRLEHATRVTKEDGDVA